MGSYADVEIDGYSVISMKSYVTPELISFFEECDRRIYQRKWSDEEGYTETTSEHEDHEDAETGYEYRIQSAQLRDRLEIQGFSLSAARASFEDSVASSLDHLAEEGFAPGFYWLENEQIEDFLRNYTFEFWVEHVREFVASGRSRYCDREVQETLPDA